MLLKDKLKELRLSMNYTQKQVSAYLNMTRQGYAHYESGRRTPDHQTLLSLSNLYKIDISELINNSTTPITFNLLSEELNFEKQPSFIAGQPINNHNKVIQLSSDEKKLFQLYKKLTVAEKRELLISLEQKVNSR